MLLNPLLPMFKGREMKKFKDLNWFKVVLFGVGGLGAAYYVTLTATALTFFLYMFLCSLMFPLILELLE